MPFAFVAHPRGMPARAVMFLHTEFGTVAEFEPEDLERIVQGLFSSFDDCALEDFDFFEVGKYMPITFERQVSWIINQA